MRYVHLVRTHLVRTQCIQHLYVSETLNLIYPYDLDLHQHHFWTGGFKFEGFEDEILGEVGVYELTLTDAGVDPTVADGGELLARRGEFLEDL